MSPGYILKKNAKERVQLPDNKRSSAKRFRTRYRFAPGMEDALERNATGREKKAGRVTRVTRLSLIEVEPS